VYNQSGKISWNFVTLIANMHPSRDLMTWTVRVAAVHLWLFTAKRKKNWYTKTSPVKRKKADNSIWTPDFVVLFLNDTL